jgi:hypothetical protein
VGIVNRRNAVIGWFTWTVGKRMLKRKAKAVVPAVDAETRRPNRSAIALVVAAAVGAATFWRRQSGSDGETQGK